MQHFKPLSPLLYIILKTYKSIRVLIYIAVIYSH